MENERNNWIVNTRILYDFISCVSLPQQPLSVDFIQPIESDVDELIYQQIACGLQVESEDDFSIYIIDVTLPAEPLDEPLRRFSKCSDYEGFPLPVRTDEPMYQCVYQIKLGVDINRVLSNRDFDGSVLLAAKSTDIYLFNLDCNDSNDDELKPIATFTGHTSEGFGLSFNKQSTQIASCSDDKLILIYDVNRPDPIYKFEHTSCLNCIDYAKHDNNFCYVSTDDGYVLVVDLRLDSPVNKTKATNSAQNCVSTNKANTNIFASASCEGVIYLWDHRNLSSSVHQIEAHDGYIVQLHFNNHDNMLIASASKNSEIKIFDIDAAGKEISNDDEVEDDDMNIPEELIFTHTGHEQRVYDFNWSINDDLYTLIASAAEDYSLQLWQMNYEILDEDENE